MDREQLVEAMAEALWAEYVRQHLRSEDWPTWGELRAQGHQGLGRVEQFKALARAALAVAEPVVREWCAEVADARVSSIGTRTENGTARIIAAAIRTGGTP